MTQRIQLRRGTAAQWNAADPVLLAGEMGIELAPTPDVADRTKIGDGITHWTALPYQDAGGDGGDPAGLLAESAARVSGDASLTAALATEVAERVAGDASLAGAIADLGGPPQAAVSRLVPVVILTGESNSGGYASNSDATPAELAPRPETLIFNNYTEVFEPLHIGVNNLLGHSGLPDNATHGFELPLANSVAAGTWLAKTVYLVKTGEGGSVISQWDSADAYWATLIDRIAKAYALLRADGLVPVPYIWLSLGINDAIAGTPTTTFQPAFTAWLQRLRVEMGYCPIFATVLPSEYGVYNTMLRAIDAADGAFYLAETSDATLRSDLNHWDYAGINLIGGRFVDLSVNRIGEREVYTLQMMQAIGGTSVGAPTPPTDPGGGGTLVPGVVTWEAFTNTSQVGDFLTLSTPATPAGARAVGTIDATAAFEVLIEYPNQADTQGVVVYLDDDSTATYDWGTQVFIAGGYHYNGGYNVAADGTTAVPTSLTAMTFPMNVKMRKSGNDVIFSSSADGGVTYTDFQTMVGALNGKTTMYLKSLFAIPGTGQQIRITVSV